MLESAKSLGTQVRTEANTEGKLKVGKKVHVLEMKFYGVEKLSKDRLSKLKVLNLA